MMEKKGRYCYDFPRPAVCIDCVVFGWNGKGLDVLLIERGHEPWKGSWATPGGFVEMDETCESAASRELEEETGLSNINLIQFHTFSEVLRDPRGRVISVSFLALIHSNEVILAHGSDAANAKWFSISQLPKLAADHAEIISVAFDYLKVCIKYTPEKIGVLAEVVKDKI